jgi:glutamate-1-semialdehyde 2,1-aminomutase
MATLFFCGHPVENYAQAKDSDRKKYARFFWAMAQRGVYLPPSQFEAMFFSAALTKDQLKKIIKSMEESLREADKEPSETPSEKNELNWLKLDKI